MATFETVATFNDKKNNNKKVTVNIAMLPLKVILCFKSDIGLFRSSITRSIYKPQCAPGTFNLD